MKPPDADNNGAVLIDISGKHQLFLNYKFDQVFLANIDNGKKPDKLIATSWKDGHRHYFLNLPAGKYAVIGTFHKGAKSGGSAGLGGGLSVGVSVQPDFNSFMESDSIAKMTADVRSGKLTIIGRYEITVFGDISVKNADTLDENQKHYAELRMPGVLKSTGILGLGRTGAYRAKIATSNSDSQTIAELNKLAAEDLKESEWEFLLNH